MALLELPLELVLHICGYVPSIQQCILRSVSRTFAALLPIVSKPTLISLKPHLYVFGKQYNTFCSYCVVNGYQTLLEYAVTTLRIKPTIPDLQCIACYSNKHESLLLEGIDALSSKQLSIIIDCVAFSANLPLIQRLVDAFVDKLVTENMKWHHRINRTYANLTTQELEKQCRVTYRRRVRSYLPLGGLECLTVAATTGNISFITGLIELMDWDHVFDSDCVGAPLCAAMRSNEPYIMVDWLMTKGTTLAKSLLPSYFFSIERTLAEYDDQIKLIDYLRSKHDIPLITMNQLMKDNDGEPLTEIQTRLIRHYGIV